MYIGYIMKVADCALNREWKERYQYPDISKLMS